MFHTTYYGYKNQRKGNAGEYIVQREAVIVYVRNWV